MKIKEQEYKECYSLLSQLKGYMFSKPKEEGLLFIFKKEKRCNLHTFFVTSSLTIVYIDKAKRVIEIKKVKPFTPFIKSPKAQYILETHKKIEIEKGEQLHF